MSRGHESAALSSRPAEGELGAGAGKQLDSALVRGVVSGEANPASNRQRLGPLLTLSRDAKLGLSEHRIEEHLGRGGRHNGEESRRDATGSAEVATWVLEKRTSYSLQLPPL